MSSFDFHVVSLPLGDEPELLDHALEALEPVAAGETAFLPEYLAWTPSGSGRAFARLIAEAQSRNINIVTTLNLGPDLVEDLPGREASARHHALCIFTRHGVVHVPQAKLATQSLETDRQLDGPGIGVVPYGRLNRVRVDLDEELVDARFLIGADVMALARFTPAELRCDLLVVLGCLPAGAERATSRLLGRALEAGVARTAVFVNAHHLARTGREPLAYKVEDVLDATRTGDSDEKWPSLRALRGAFYVYEDGAAPDFVALSALPRRGRVPVPRSRWEAPLALGEYPVTVVL